MPNWQGGVGFKMVQVHACYHQDVCLSRRGNAKIIGCVNQRLNFHRYCFSIDCAHELVLMWFMLTQIDCNLLMILSISDKTLHMTLCTINSILPLFVVRRFCVSCVGLFCCVFTWGFMFLCTITVTVSSLMSLYVSFYYLFCTCSSLLYVVSETNKWRW